MDINTKKLPIYKLFINSKKYSIKWSSYFQVYEKIFSTYRNKKIKFVEIGVANGGSLFMWQNYFGKKAKIIGIDFNPNAKKLQKHGFKIYIGDQSDKKFWDKFYQKEGKIDIILDDGGHKNLQQISTVHHSLPFIKDGGKIVVEDTSTSFVKKEFNNPSKYSFINFAKNIVDVIHKRSPLLGKNLNFYSKKVFLVEFFESITVFSIDSRKCFTNKEISNKAKNEWAIDYRHNDYFSELKTKLNKKYGHMNKKSLLRKVFRKLFYRNFIFDILDKIKIKKIFKEMKN
ncbi:class I SAM-dependent methyltransferase [Pelagibacterales bacterium SAG-MED13]|nr:class I SAM-dependent methyltransferase [Pelagibacterales bacterium SAG-MED13]